MSHDLHQVTDHFFANPAHQGRAFLGYANHHLPPVLSRTRADDVAEILQPRDQAARRCGRVSHLLRNRRHGQHFLVIECREKKELWERNITRRQFFAEMQHEAALHFHDDVRQTFGIETQAIGLYRRSRAEGRDVQRV